MSGQFVRLRFGPRFYDIKKRPIAFDPPTKEGMRVGNMAPISLVSEEDPNWIVVNRVEQLASVQGRSIFEIEFWNLAIVPHPGFDVTLTSNWDPEFYCEAPSPVSTVKVSLSVLRGNLVLSTVC
jgi:hypothetical protein